jgi:citrate synthase
MNTTANTSTGTAPGTAPAGLKGVVAADTSVGDVRGAEGRYHYRQYDAAELARRIDVESVWHLLLQGHLPDRSERAAFADQLRHHRRLPDALLPGLEVVARSGGPFLARLRSALSLAAAQRGCRPLLDLDAAARRADVLALGALVPSLVGALWRLEQGRQIVPARDDLDHTAHYLWSALGVVPAPEEIRAVETYLVATIDHGFNASTFTGRVVASTGADAGAALVAALGALSGPLHGGAPSRALDALDEIGDPSRARSWVAAALARGEKIMGFGHAVYTAPDPRSALLRGVARELGGARVAQAEAVEAAIAAALAELKPAAALPTNVEYYAGVVMERCGLPPDLFTPTFAVSRVIGWGVHMVEEAARGRMIRPSSRYVGPWPLEPVPAVDPAPAAVG